ncbi:MAG: hypothetical protein WCJ61_13985, partial [Paludibacter sp.]
MKQRNGLMAVILSGAIVLSGCSSMSSAVKGGLLGGGAGAAVGAGVGALIGKNAKSAAIGAAVGTAVGATGTSATVGCENNDGSVGTEVSNNFTFPKTANGDPKAGTNIHFKYGTQPDFDGSVLTTTLKEVEKNGSITIAGGFVNYGKTAITSMDINYSIDGGAAVTQNLTGLNIAANGGGVYNFSHSTAWTGQTSGQTYAVKIWASNFNNGGTDGDNSNDELSTNV